MNNSANLRAVSDLSNLKKQADGLKSSTKVVEDFSHAAGTLGTALDGASKQYRNGASNLSVLLNQGPLLLSLLGPYGRVAGAVLGLGNSIAKSFIPNVSDARVKILELKSVTDSLDQVMRRASDGSFALTNNLKSLAKTDPASAKLKFLSGAALSKDASKTSAGIVRNTIDSHIGEALSTTTTGAVHEIDQIRGDGGDPLAILNGGSVGRGRGSVRTYSILKSQVAEVREEFGVTQAEALKLVEATGRARLNPSIETLDSLRTTVTQIAIAYEDGHEKLHKFGQALSEQSAAAVEAQKREGAFKSVGDIDEFLKQPNVVNVSTTTAKATAEAELQANVERELVGQQRLESVESFLRTEEEAILASYERRRQIIVDNANSPEQEAALLERNDGRFASDILGGFGMSTEGSLEEQEAAINEKAEYLRELILGNTQLTGQARTDLEVQLATEREEALAALESQKTDMILGGSQQLFGSLAALAKASGGEQSKAYKSLFALSKGFAIAQSILAIQTNIAQAAKIGFPQNLPLIAGAIAQGASIISTIKGTNFSGAYDNGGLIPAGKFGLVGEIGPELVQGPANVTSRKETAKLLGSGGDNLTIINNGAPVRVVSDNRISENERQIIIAEAVDQSRQAIASDVARGGNGVSDSFEGVYGMDRAVGARR